MDVFRELDIADNWSHWPKGIFPMDLHFNGDVCKTVERSKKVDYFSLYFEFLIHEGFCVCKTFQEFRKVIFIRVDIVPV